MIKYFFYISLSLLFLNSAFAKDVDIQEDINLSFVCDLEKKILKNSEYNYQTFLAKDLDDKDLDKFDIEAKKHREQIDMLAGELGMLENRLNKLEILSSKSKKS